MQGQWNWWFGSDAGLMARIGIGAAIFATLAVADLLRRGRAATRWREYAFLAAVVAAAAVYGIANDTVAVHLSWEYFYYGKGIHATILFSPPVLPPKALLFLWYEACRVGAKASFSVGLIVGAAMLIANNPRPGRPQLRYGELFKLLVIVLACAAIGAGIGSAIGWRGGWNWMSPDLSAIWREGLFRPRRFMTVYGMNLGGYAGAAAGTIAAITQILRRRSNS